MAQDNVAAREEAVNLAELELHTSRETIFSLD